MAWPIQSQPLAAAACGEPGPRLWEHKNSIFIVDTRKGFEDTKADVEWGFSYFLPELKKTGCKTWGFILPEISEIDEEIDLWMKEIEKNFRVIRATSYDEILKDINGYKINIEHIAMYVNDLEACRKFFIDYLGGKSNDGYHNKTTGFKSYFISFDSGARLELMNKSEISGLNMNPERIGYSHIAFSVGSKNKVDELTDRLKSAGYIVKSGPRTTGDGYYESCIVAIEGNLIEITI